MPGSARPTATCRTRDHTPLRLNNVLYDVIAGAMTDVAKSMFLAQDVEVFERSAELPASQDCRGRGHGKQ